MHLVLGRVDTQARVAGLVKDAAADVGVLEERGRDGVAINWRTDLERQELGEAG